MAYMELDVPHLLSAIRLSAVIWIDVVDESKNATLWEERAESSFSKDLLEL